jgi:hypothetical protein
MKTAVDCVEEGAWTASLRIPSYATGKIVMSITPPLLYYLFIYLENNNKM